MKIIKTILIICITAVILSSCEVERKSTDNSETVQNFNPVQESTGENFVGILHDGIFYSNRYCEGIYPEQQTAISEDAIAVGEVESKTLLETTSPYADNQTNCFALPLGSKIYILGGTLYAYNEDTETFWLFYENYSPY